MISIKDYAREKNVSYEAVRKQIKRYSKELQGHINKVDRTQFLDDEAVAFLDKKRKTNPVIILERNKDEEIAQLQEENKALLLKLNEMHEKLEAAQQQLISEKEITSSLKTQLLEAAQDTKEEKTDKKSFWQKLFG